MAERKIYAYKGLLQLGGLTQRGTFSAAKLPLLEQKTIANRKQNYSGNTNRLATSLSSK